MVLLESMVSGHKVVAIRPRIKEEIQMLRYDPHGKFNFLVTLKRFVLI